MIHYHGTPIGGTQDEAARFLVGRHGLVSFYTPVQLDDVANYCQSFCLDNGAFSHWQAGKGDIDFTAYWSWVQDLQGHPGLDFAIIPDKIDGNETDNEALVTRWLRQGSGVEGAPVYHLHESLEYLDYLVANFRTVALGSSGQWAMPGTVSWWERMEKVMEVACNKAGRPRCRLHGLRMLDPQIFTRLPLASADSTNAAVNSGALQRFGSYIPPTRSQRAAVIADRTEAYNSAEKWVPQVQTEFTLEVEHDG